MSILSVYVFVGGARGLILMTSFPPKVTRTADQHQKQFLQIKGGHRINNTPGKDNSTSKI